MWEFFQVAAVCGTLYVLSLRAEKVLVKKWEYEYEVVDDEEEEEAEEEEVSPPSDPMPVDLLNFALQESEDWARLGMIRSMQDMYDTCHDWNVVRAALKANPTEQH